MYDLYIYGGAVRALQPDTIHDVLLIGGEFDSSACSSTISWATPVLAWEVTPPNDGYGNLDCTPVRDFTASSSTNPFPVLNPSVWSLAVAVSNYSPGINYIALGGRFTYEECNSPPFIPDDFYNVYFVPHDYMWSYFHSCSDTTFAVAMLPNSCNNASFDENFTTYIAARCALCNCNNSATIDSSRYIAMYEPYQNCNYTQGVNYMQGGTNGPVYAIQAPDSANVYAGGKFDSAGTIKANNIAKWNGTSWDSLGSGVNGVVKALLAYNGKLYAGGNFTTAGGMPANNIAVWNGSAWSALGTGTNGAVYALTIHNGDLYAGGGFTQAGGNTVNNVAKWDGTNWSALAGGRNNEVYALASFKGDLYAGGKFTGGMSDTAKYIARFMDTTLIGIQELNSNVFSTYPNPTTGVFTITTEQTAIKNIEVINVLGEKVYWLNVHTLLNHTSTIDLSSKPNGIYFLQLKTENGIANKKIIINK